MLFFSRYRFMKTTINDIAKKAGLSPTTVSKYLNHKPLRAHNINKLEKAIAASQLRICAYKKVIMSISLSVTWAIISGVQLLHRSINV